MNEPSISRLALWRTRFVRLRTLSRRSLPFVAGVVATFIAVLAYGAFYPPPKPLTTNDVSTSIARAMASATAPPAYSSMVYQVIQPSLVLIQTTSTDNNNKTEDGLGSGVIIDSNGDILTSLHVVAGSSSIQVTFADGTQSDAQIATQQPTSDIAVLHTTKLPAQVIPATLGNPNSLSIGDEAYVVGNPFGLYGSMSAGVISGLKREFKMPNNGPTLQNMIQVDAAINPGNSGGPLLNRAGQVVGIVTGLLNPSNESVFIGIGFAVPIDVAGGAAGAPLD